MVNPPGPGDGPLCLSGPEAPAIERISYGFPVDLFRPRDRQVCREILNLPRDKFIVLFPASSILDDRKGADQVRALVRNLQVPGLMFTAMGYGSANELGLPPDQFKALGYIEDPERIALVYAAADVIVAPSSEETLGQIFVEAFASGTPAVGHGLTGTADALLDGMTGLDNTNSGRRVLLETYSTGPPTGTVGAGMRWHSWGRVHAENEWSLEACAQHFFSALRRLGLVDTIGLPHKISLRRETSEQQNAVRESF